MTITKYFTKCDSCGVEMESTKISNKVLLPNRCWYRSEDEQTFCPNCVARLKLDYADAQYTDKEMETR